MRLADQHSHSFPCSFDAADTLHTMAAAAKDRGLRCITFTDHLDMADPKTGRLAMSEAELQRQLDSFAARRAEYEAQPIAGLEVSFGMELGAAVQQPALAAQAAGLPGLDLVIGSLHNLPDVTDFYFYEYQSEADCEALNRRYLAELLRLA